MQAGEFELWIDVVFDHVEGEVVESAEAEDGGGEEEGCNPVGVKQEEQAGSQNSAQKH